MVSLSLEGYIYKYDKFPESPDANGFLSIIPIIIRSFTGKASEVTPINLVKYTDNSSTDLSIYEVSVSCPAPFEFPLPFCAPDDEAALQRLQEVIDWYNNKGLGEIYKQGELIERVHNPRNPEKRELLKTALHPEYAGDPTLIDVVLLS